MTFALTDKQYNELIQARLKSPESFKKALVSRKRRKMVGKDGRLLIVAADHTARGIISAGSEKYIIANRRLLLDRLVRSLSNPNVDGVLASADIVEELAWLGALESKLVFGTMNRGGYLGTTWGLDDPMTAYDADSIAELGLDAGKVLVRFEDTDIGVGRTIEYVVEAMRLLAEREIVCLVEPLPYKKDANGMPMLDKSTDRLDKIVSITAGFGSSASYTWLKLPSWTSHVTLRESTTLPILLLGGDPGENLDTTFEEWRSALQIPNVIGLVAGRPLLYPFDNDVERSVDRAA
ncbi:MAG: Cgl0159 family (beta/alpha)8-fold protein, partial [Ilumatobacteraceae bacterium]